MPLTSEGFTASTPSRRRRRWPIVTAVVLVLVLAAVVVVLVLKKQHDDNERKQTRQATDAGRTYLAAWSKADDGGVTAASVPGVQAVVTAMDKLRTGLKVDSAVYAAGVLSRHGSTADQPYSATLQLRGFGAYRYSGQVTVEKSGGRWLAAPTLASVHPDLTQAGESLVQSRVAATRGRLLDVNGEELSSDSELAGNLVGQVGTLTAAQAKAAGPQFAAGDRAGTTGLERVYNSQLGGTPGGAIVVKDAGGGTVKTLVNRAPSAGTDLKTTLDLRVQRAGEQALAQATKPNAALVALDTQTGAVLALVNHPLNGYGRADQGQYAPGSTFKVITATAALMNGRSANTPTQCTPTATADGRVFKNAENEQFGTINLETAFAKSCNTAFINLEKGLPSGAVGTAAALYGFDATDPPTAPLPVRSFGGSYPKPTDGADAAAAAIGQGRVLASPLQMASVAAAVGSGTWHRPFVAGSSPASHQLPANVVGPLRQFMQAVVTSGTAAGIPFPAGTAGKTGTAEYGNATPGGQTPTNAWFVGYHGAVAFAVLVEDGGFGADTAAPLASRFLTALGS